LVSASLSFHKIPNGNLIEVERRDWMRAFTTFRILRTGFWLKIAHIAGGARHNLTVEENSVYVAALGLMLSFEPVRVAHSG
jgi:hypothetical protein